VLLTCLFCDTEAQEINIRANTIICDSLIAPVVTYAMVIEYENECYNDSTLHILDSWIKCSNNRKKLERELQFYKDKYDATYIKRTNGRWDDGIGYRDEKYTLNVVTHLYIHKPVNFKEFSSWVRKKYGL